MVSNNECCTNLNAFHGLSTLLLSLQLTLVYAEPMLCSYISFNIPIITSVHTYTYTLCRYPFTIITSLVISTISVLLWFSSCSFISVRSSCTLMSNTDQCTLTHMHIHIHTHILAIVCG